MTRHALTIPLAQFDLAVIFIYKKSRPLEARKER
jgi:hypothetical protein